MSTGTTTVTVTMNPAVDKTAEIAKLTPGGLNRLENVMTDAGGKGINVSKMMAVLGKSSTATGFLGGGSGREIERMLQGLDIKADFVHINHTTRTNLKVFSQDHGITEFNEPGAVVTPDEVSELREKLLAYAGPDAVFVLSGSLPRGVKPEIYQSLISAVKERGAKVFLDADGEAFRLALLAKPDFIKPNKFELTQYFGTGEDISVKECADLCMRFIDNGAGMVTLSMGAEGALFVSRNEVLYAPGLPVRALSTVGAGDSMVGAAVHAFGEGMGFRDAAALAMAASAGAVTTEGTKPPGRETVNSLLKLVKFETI